MADITANRLTPWACCGDCTLPPPHLLLVLKIMVMVMMMIMMMMIIRMTMIAGMLGVIC